ncbi:acyl carrier protein [Streptomyces xanthochromogenes]|uniref:acyl carrier protein n=1 Tax=Streptomyces xanthochromogenes TaxID=67384 RepID=UPI0016758AED|nr:acyl carrier protein [Streptomyces xanthochromogenes]
MEHAKILDRILQFLAGMPGWRGEVEADTPILENGQLDSLGIVSLMGYIEESLGVEIPESEFQFERFATPRSIADLVRDSADGSVAV